jgi:hypothetical protein
MDESAVRDAAQSHGDATVAGDLRAAGKDLTPAAMAQAGGVMKQMPQNLDGAEVAAVQLEGDEAVVTIKYSGGGDSATVLSRWGEIEGELKILDLQVTS